MTEPLTHDRLGRKINVHGTKGTYGRGCRCEPCREAAMLYQKNRRGAKQPKPVEKPKKSRGTAAAVYNDNGSTFAHTLTLSEWKAARAKADLVHIVVPGLAS